jgi:hypothetical protein
MDLEFTMLSELIQTMKDKHCILSLIVESRATKSMTRV